MDYVSTRVITNDIKRLVAFYEKITQLKANWLNELFAEVGTPHGALAIGAVETRKLFGAESIQPASSQSATIEFRVDDVGQPLAAVPRPRTAIWSTSSRRRARKRRRSMAFSGRAVPRLRRPRLW